VQRHPGVDIVLRLGALEGAGDFGALIAEFSDKSCTFV
jgi:hypothetical protein